MEKVRAKKRLGQHFLNDENIAKKIVSSLAENNSCKNVLEIGPGMGVLTKYLIQEKSFETSVVEVDRESVAYLKKNFDSLKIIHEDFLELNLSSIFTGPFSIIGNFPYNISSQILFKILDFKDQIPAVVGMFQKEVAERIAAKPGTKAYGIISVFIQAYYNIETLFTFNETVFSPPPKVKSTVIRLMRNNVESLDCDEELFQKVVKTGFNQRRKMLRNSVRSLLIEGYDVSDFKFAAQRPEELTVNEFIELTNFIASPKNL